MSLSLWYVSLMLVTISLKYEFTSTWVGISSLYSDLCNIDILCTLDLLLFNASLVNWSSDLRACILSNELTTWRLFFTLWWISFISSSLVASVSEIFWFWSLSCFWFSWFFRYSRYNPKNKRRGSRRRRTCLLKGSPARRFGSFLVVEDTLSGNGMMRSGDLGYQRCREVCPRSLKMDGKDTCCPISCLRARQTWLCIRNKSKRWSG